MIQLSQWWRDRRRGYTDEEHRFAMLKWINRGSSGDIVWMTKGEMKAISTGPFHIQN